MKWLDRLWALGFVLLVAYIILLVMGKAPLPAFITKMFPPAAVVAPDVKTYDIVDIKLSDAKFTVYEIYQDSRKIDMTRSVGGLNQQTYIVIKTCSRVEIGYDFKDFWESDYSYRTGNVLYIYLPRDRAKVFSVSTNFNWDNTEEALKFGLEYDAECVTRPTDAYNGLFLPALTTADNTTLALAIAKKQVAEMAMTKSEWIDHAYAAACADIKTQVHSLPGYEGVQVQCVLDAAKFKTLSSKSGEGFSPGSFGPTPTPTLIPIDYHAPVNTPTPIGLQSSPTLP